MTPTMDTPENQTELVEMMGEALELMTAQLRYERKQNRKLTDQINRIRKFIPGKSRVWRLHKIAIIMEADAEVAPNRLEQSEMESDSLFLNRLAFDIETLRIADSADSRGDQGRPGSKYDPAQWPRGERP